MKQEKISKESSLESKNSNNRSNRSNRSNSYLRGRSKSPKRSEKRQRNRSKSRSYSYDKNYPPPPPPSATLISSNSSSSSRNNKEREREREKERERENRGRHKRRYSRSNSRSNSRLRSRSRNRLYSRSKSRSNSYQKSNNDNNNRRRNRSRSRNRSYSRSHSRNRSRSYSNDRRRRSHSNKKEKSSKITDEKNSTSISISTSSQSNSTDNTSNTSNNNNNNSNNNSNNNNTNNNTSSILIPTKTIIGDEKSQLTTLQQQQQLALQLVLSGNINNQTPLDHSQLNNINNNNGITPIIPPISQSTSATSLLTSSISTAPSPFTLSSSITPSRIPSGGLIGNLGIIPTTPTTTGITASSASTFTNPINPLFPSTLTSSLFVEPKEYKELFVGNTPSGTNDMVLLEFLNAAMRHSGLYTGPEGIEPILTCRLSNKFAFVETRTSQDATNAMNLNNIPFLGNVLKIGRPTKYYGPITPFKTFQELVASSGFTPINPIDRKQQQQQNLTSNNNSLSSHSLTNLTSSTSSTIPLSSSSSAAATTTTTSTTLSQSSINSTSPLTSQSLSNSQTIITNDSITLSSNSSNTTSTSIPIPTSTSSNSHGQIVDPTTKPYRELFVGNTSPEMNPDNLKEFIGNALEKMGFLNSPGNPILNVRMSQRFAFMEVRSVEEAANCINLNGIPFLGQSLKISRPAKYSGTLITHYNWDDILSRWMTGELKTLTSGPPSRVLMFTNMFSIEDLNDDDIYQELIDETRDEIKQFGTIKSIIIPRPNLNIQSHQLQTLSIHKGIGKVFIEMSTLDESKAVLMALKGRTFDGRIVDVKYFPYEKFIIQDYSNPSNVILTASGFIDSDVILGNKIQGNMITMNTPTAAQLSAYANLNSINGSSINNSSNISGIKTNGLTTNHIIGLGYSGDNSNPPYELVDSELDSDLHSLAKK